MVLCTSPIGSDRALAHHDPDLSSSSSSSAPQTRHRREPSATQAFARLTKARFDLEKRLQGYENAIMWAQELLFFKRPIHMFVLVVMTHGVLWYSSIALERWPLLSFIGCAGAFLQLLWLGAVRFNLHRFLIPIYSSVDGAKTAPLSESDGRRSVSLRNLAADGQAFAQAAARTAAQTLGVRRSANEHGIYPYSEVMLFLVNFQLQVTDVFNQYAEFRKQRPTECAVFTIGVLLGSALFFSFFSGLFLVYLCVFSALLTPGVIHSGVIEPEKLQRNSAQHLQRLQRVISVYTRPAAANGEVPETPTLVHPPPENQHLMDPTPCAPTLPSKKLD